jgi:hypothetical protein
MVWDPFALFDGDFVRDDRQAGVELHRVAVDDFAIVALG